MKYAHAIVITAILTGAFAASCEPGFDGTEYSSVSSTIVGGNPVAEGDWPAVGAVRLGMDSMCTGTLISPKIVVTAAHCVKDEDPNRFTLGFDMNNGTKYEVVHAFYPGSFPTDPYVYDAGDWKNPGSHDVGVLVLKTAVTGVTPAKLFSETFLALNNQDVTFVGYGNRDGYGNAYGQKYQVTVKIEDIDQYGFWNYTTIEDTHNTCGGDSGGPGFVLDSKGKYVIAGFVSSGDEWCVEDGYNMRADNNAEWLNQMIQKYDPTAVITPECDNGDCEEGETPQNCPQDCPVVVDDVMEDTLVGEDTSDAGSDDVQVTDDNGAGTDLNSTDESTDTGTICQDNCRDIKFLCGNNICETGETCQVCPRDCGPCDGTDATGDASTSEDVTPPSSGGCSTGPAPVNPSGILIVVALCGVAFAVRRLRRYA